MSDHPIIATPHGVEAVEAVVQHTSDWAEDAVAVAGDNYSWTLLDVAKRIFQVSLDDENGPYIIGHLHPGQYLVRHLDNTVTVHDTDPRIEPTLEWRTPAPIRGGHYYNDEETVRRLAEKHGTPIEQEATYPVTLAGKPYTLVGEWVEVAP